MVLLQGPTGWRFLISEVSLYGIVNEAGHSLNRLFSRVDQLALFLVRARPASTGVQGYLAYKKTHPP